MYAPHITPAPTLANRLKGLNHARKVLFNSSYSAEERELARAWLSTPAASQARLALAELRRDSRRRLAA